MSEPSAIGNWKIGKRLGSGNQGHTYLAQRSDDPNAVGVIKLLARIDSSQARARFAREIQALKTVRHPGIVEILDQSTPDSEQPFYVMRFIKGAVTLASSWCTTSSHYESDAIWS